MTRQSHTVHTVFYVYAYLLYTVELHLHCSKLELAYIVHFSFPIPVVYPRIIVSLVSIISSFFTANLARFSVPYSMLLHLPLPL
jgi:hypothetical protein